MTIHGRQWGPGFTYPPPDDIEKKTTIIACIYIYIYYNLFLFNLCMVIYIIVGEEMISVIRTSGYLQYFQRSTTVVYLKFDCFKQPSLSVWLFKTAIIGSYVHIYPMCESTYTLIIFSTTTTKNWFNFWTHRRTWNWFEPFSLINDLTVTAKNPSSAFPKIGGNWPPKYGTSQEHMTASFQKTPPLPVNYTNMNSKGQMISR